MYKEREEFETGLVLVGLMCHDGSAVGDEKRRWAKSASSLVIALGTLQGLGVVAGRRRRWG